MNPYIRAFGAFIVILLLAGFALSAAMLIGVAVLSFNLWLLSQVGVKTSETATTLLGFSGAAIAFVVTRALEFDREQKARLAEQRRTAYSGLIGPWIDVLVATKESTPANLTNDKAFRDRVFKGMFDALMYGSDGVIKAYGAFRLNAAGGGLKPWDSMKHLADLVRAIRGDLGHSKDGLTDEEILRVFINDYKEGGSSIAQAANSTDRSIQTGE